jgi:hypothetical protein
MVGRFQKHQHPLFLEDENIFQKSARVHGYNFIAISGATTLADF